MIPTSTHIEPFNLRNVLRTMEQYDLYINEASLLSGNEKYNTLLVPFTGTINFIHSIVMNFASRITKFNKDLKRSELKVHHDRYPLNCRQVLNAHYVDIAEIHIPFPNGMTGFYLDTIQSIKHFFDYTSLSMFELYKNNMTELYKHLSIENLIDENILHPKQFLKGTVEKEREELFKNHIEHFSANTTPLSIEFNKKFRSMDEFAECDSILLSLDEVLTNIKAVIDLVKDTTIVTDKVVAFINDSEKKKDLLTPEFLKGLIEYVRSIAEAYDMYATVLETTIAVEHNFVKVFDTVFHSI